MMRWPGILATVSEKVVRKPWPYRPAPRLAPLPPAGPPPEVPISQRCPVTFALDREIPLC